MHALNAFNDRRNEARALRAAQGPSLAPKDYEPDTASRSHADKYVSAFTGLGIDTPNSNADYKLEEGRPQFDNSKGSPGRKTAYSKAALNVDHNQETGWDTYMDGEDVPAPKVPVNKKKYNLKKLTGKKAKK